MLVPRIGLPRRWFSAGATLEIKTPDFGAESITEGTLVEWTKNAGDFVSAGEIIAVIETDKVSVEVKAESAGTLQEILAKPDDTVGVGQLLAVIKLGGEAPAAGVTAAPKVEVAKAPVEKTEVPKPTTPAVPAQAGAKSLELDETSGREERRVKMTRMRQRIAARLKESQNTAAMLTTFQEVDMGALMELRKDYKELFEGMHGVRLGFMSAFVKASGFALQQIPAVNAVIDDATNEIVYRDYVDVSVAVASPRGLVVPVLRNVESMSLQGIEAGIAGYAAKAKQETLTMEEMTGGTFTISNGGTFGSMMGTPIINPPQSAILGMHATKQRPVVLKSGAIVPRPMMYLALTYDHRLVDGREAVTFLCTIRDVIEDPRRLLLEL